MKQVEESGYKSFDNRLRTTDTPPLFMFALSSTVDLPRSNQRRKTIWFVWFTVDTYTHKIVGAAISVYKHICVQQTGH